MIEALRQDELLVLRLNRPEKANAYTQAMLRELDAHFAQARDDVAIRAVILTGAGRHFCAGADLSEMRARTPLEALDLASAAVFARVAAFPKPVIAALNGDAVGGGLELALACDLRFAAEGARLRFPEIELGLIPAAGGAARLARFIGLGHAKEMILSGAVVDAHTAKEWGLVNEVLPAEAVLTRATEVARGLARLDARAYAAAKSVLDAGRADDAALLLSRLAQATLRPK